MSDSLTTELLNFWWQENVCQTLITELYIYYISGGRGVSDTYISHLCTWHRLNLGHLTIQDTLSQSNDVHIREVPLYHLTDQACQNKSRFAVTLMVSVYITLCFRYCLFLSCLIPIPHSGFHPIPMCSN